jgi:thymidylate kinase
MEAPKTTASPVETVCAPNDLIGDLLTMLDAEKIRYCHWKSNWKIERWLRAEGDLDLLIRNADVCQFTSIVSRMGFKKALPPADKDLPGVINYYGYDAKTGKFIHIHAHYQLVFGHDLTKNYRLPIESALLDSAVAHGAVRLTAPEIELILFVVRMVLKFSAAETFARRAAGTYENFSGAIRREIEYLESQIKPPALVDDALRRHFPMLDKNLFDDCLASLQPKATISRQFVVKRKLEQALAPHARQTRPVESIVRLKRRAAAIGQKFILKNKSRKRLENGGALIALVGGDGAGKSTCVKEISRWLSKKFQTEAIHIGKPPKSALTLSIAAAQKAQRALYKIGIGNHSPDEDETTLDADFLQRLRWLSTARDRYRLYIKARRRATNGAVVICDRYPVSQAKLMDSPKIARSLNKAPKNGLIKKLVEREEWYYRQIMPPDILLVLRVDPETAVRRKKDEPAEHVRTRSAELWQIDWQGTGAYLIDTSRKIPEVLAELRSLIWRKL